MLIFTLGANIAFGLVYSKGRRLIMGLMKLSCRRRRLA